MPMSVDRPAARRLLSLPPLLLLPLLLLLALSGVAGAQASGGEATRAARAHNAAAREHFKRGEYAKAAGRYEQAFKARPLPVFLYNIAQSLKRHAGGELVDQVGRLVVELYFVQADDAGVNEPGHVACFVEQSGGVARSVREALDRDVAAELRVLGKVDHALTTPPEHARWTKTADGGRQPGRGGGSG